MVVRNGEKEYKQLDGGCRRKVLAYSDNIMNVELLFEKGGKGAMHSHPHEQIGYVIEGSLQFCKVLTELCTSYGGQLYCSAQRIARD